MLVSIQCSNTMEALRVVDKKIGASTALTAEVELLFLVLKSAEVELLFLVLKQSIVQDLRTTLH